MVAVVMTCDGCNLQVVTTVLDAFCHGDTEVKRWLKFRLLDSGIQISNPHPVQA